MDVDGIRKTSSQQEEQKKLFSQAASLHFNKLMHDGKRPSRHIDGKNIDLQKSKHPDTIMKWKILSIASILGWSPLSLNFSENKKNSKNSNKFGIL